MAKKNSRLSPEEREQFEHYLFEMDDVLGIFVEQARNAGYQLDYSMDSLAQLEAYWWAIGESASDGTAGNRAARYLGEVFRRQLGGKWELCDKGHRYLYDKRPVIVGYSKVDLEFCPMEIFANFARRREQGMLRRAVEAHRDC
jgi:hypothetical protein